MLHFVQHDTPRVDKSLPALWWVWLGWRGRRYNIVTLRRGIRDIDGCTYALCPDVRVYRCLTSLRVAMLRVVGISKGDTTMVDRHRIA